METRTGTVEAFDIWCQKRAIVPTDGHAIQQSLFDTEQKESQLAQEVKKEQRSLEGVRPSKPYEGRNQIPAHFPAEEVVIEPEQDTTTC